MISDLSPTGAGSIYEYDEVVDLISAVTNKAGIRFEYTYDASANVLTEAKENGIIKRTEYDSMNRPVAEINALGGAVRYAYDLAGRITEETNPLGGTTAYAYDVILTCNLKALNI